MKISRLTGYNLARKRKLAEINEDMDTKLSAYSHESPSKKIYLHPAISKINIHISSFVFS